MVPAAIIIIIVFALLVGWNIILRIENAALRRRDGKE